MSFPALVVTLKTMAPPPDDSRRFRRLLGSAARRVSRPASSLSSRLLRERALPRQRPLSHSREKLLIEAQRITFREIHRRFADRTRHGERGLGAALVAFDALWHAVRDLRDGAPFLVETLALAGQDSPAADRLATFYTECTAMLTDGIRRVFDEDLEKLTVPPERMAVLIRICLSGLLVELAQVSDESDLAEVEQAYADIRELFQRFVLANHLEDSEGLPDVPLPW